MTRTMNPFLLGSIADPHLLAPEPDTREMPALRPAGGSLEGKRLLITGVADPRSLAYAVAECALREGAEVILTGFGSSLGTTRRAATQLPVTPEVLELDVNEHADLERLVNDLADRWDSLDGVLHAIASAPSDARGGAFMQTTPESAELAFRTSAYSLKALAGATAPLMDRGGSIVSLDFDASVAWPEYDWMGVAKAALESVNRYLCRDLGPKGIRLNLISTGPIDTPAADRDSHFNGLVDAWRERAPLGWDPSDPNPVAETACFLLADASRGITGQILKVDGGYSALGA